MRGANGIFWTEPFQQVSCSGKAVRCRGQAKSFPDRQRHFLGSRRRLVLGSKHSRVSNSELRRLLLNAAQGKESAGSNTDGQKHASEDLEKGPPKPSSDAKAASQNGDQEVKVDLLPLEEVQEVSRTGVTEDQTSSSSGRGPPVVTHITSYLKQALAYVKKSWKRLALLLGSVLGWLPWLAREMKLRQLRHELKKDPTPER